jgi:hypothetical protein
MEGGTLLSEALILPTASLRSIINFITNLLLFLLLLFSLPPTHRRERPPKEANFLRDEEVGSDDDGGGGGVVQPPATAISPRGYHGGRIDDHYSKPPPAALATLAASASAWPTSIFDHFVSSSVCVIWRVRDYESIASTSPFCLFFPPPPSSIRRRRRCRSGLSGPAKYSASSEPSASLSALVAAANVIFRALELVTHSSQ